MMVFSGKFRIITTPSFQGFVQISEVSFQEVTIDANI